MSDPVQITMLLVSLIGTIIFPGVMSYLVARLNRQAKGIVDKQEEAVRKAEEVRRSLIKRTNLVRRTLLEDATVRDQKLEDLAAVTRATYTMGDGATEALLRVIALNARRIANLTGDSHDLEASEIADATLESHMARKAEVAAQPGTIDQKSGRGSGSGSGSWVTRALPPPTTTTDTPPMPDE